MAKKLKDPNKHKARKEKARAFNSQFSKLPSGVADMPQGTILSDEVATNPLIEELVDDGKHYILVFDKYESKECELSKLSTPQAKSLIKKFQQITKCNPKLLPQSGIVRDNINNSGSYKGLFRNLNPDIELKETSLADYGRMFFYIVNRYFCVVAIQSAHKNINN